MVPALVVVVGVIVFPWAFTLWMSVHEWKVGAAPAFVGLSNYTRLPTDPRFLDAVWQTLVYTALSVVLPLILGTLAACVFHAKFPLRGFLRGVFILPMMATPVAIALVWTMMFHPQLGVLNYLLSLVGIPPALGVPSGDRDPVAGAGRDLAMDAARDADRARRPRGFAHRALRERADRRRLDLADVPPHHPAAGRPVPVRRRDDPDDRRGEELRHHLRHYPRRTRHRLGTINIYLYSVAFAYYDVGYGSAIAVVFFLLIIALAAALLVVRKRTQGAVA